MPVIYNRTLRKDWLKMGRIHLKDSFIRYEPDIDGGTMFLFNKENGEMLEGDYYSYVVVRTLKDGGDFAMLADNIASENNRDLAEVQHDLDKILSVLSEKGFVEYE